MRLGQAVGSTQRGDQGNDDHRKRDTLGACPEDMWYDVIDAYTGRERERERRERKSLYCSCIRNAGP